MLVIFINNVTGTNENKNQTSLAEDILLRLNDSNDNDEECVVFTFCGGSGKNEMVLVSENNYVVNVVPKLYEYTAFKGYQLFRDDILLQATSTTSNSKNRQPTFMVLDNTCVLHKDFPMKMFWINNVKLPETESTWVFAHTYGLYNMGIGNTAFMDEYCSTFEDVVEDLQKQTATTTTTTNVTSTSLNTANTSNDKIRSLQEFSHHTLKKQTITNTSFDDGIMSTDTFSVTGIDDNGVRKFMAYISAFGVFKFFTADSSYVFPVWASKSHVATSVEMVGKLKDMIADARVECDLFPLVPYSQTV